MTKEIKFPPVPEPVASQFKAADGTWLNFINDKHRQDTIAAGYEVRDLMVVDQLHAYARPILEQRDELAEAVQVAAQYSLCMSAEDAAIVEKANRAALAKLEKTP